MAKLGFNLKVICKREGHVGAKAERDLWHIISTFSLCYRPQTPTRNRKGPFRVGVNGGSTQAIYIEHVF